MIDSLVFVVCSTCSLSLYKNVSDKSISNTACCSFELTWSLPKCSGGNVLRRSISFALARLS